jgi:hypothetical protein
MSQTVAAPIPAAVDYERTLVLAIEVSNRSWVLAAQVPGLPHTKAKRTIDPEAEALLAAVTGYRARAAATGRSIERVIAVYEAGWSGFWLARWLMASSSASSGTGTIEHTRGSPRSQARSVRSSNSESMPSDFARRFRRSSTGKSAGLALKDFVNIRGGVPEEVGQVRYVGHKPVSVHELSRLIYWQQSVLRRESHNQGVQHRGIDSALILAARNKDPLTQINGRASCPGYNKLVTP